ncbi:MAG: thiol peroxidase [Phycisphaeraceae bacterium]|nr:thiol peroxidase [Phycisphaeraceae bacterium]
MTDRAGAITFKGNPMTLTGNPVKVGQKAPDFTAVANDLSEKKLADFKGKTVILSVVPSLDTGICDRQTRRFNEEVGKLGDKAALLTISMDLPFAQKRWCGAADAKNVIAISDYKDRKFGQAYGLYIKELGLLARAVLVIDGQGVVKYQELVPEVAQEPNYDAALAAVKAAG